MRLYHEHAGGEAVTMWIAQEEWEYLHGHGWPPEKLLGWVVGLEAMCCGLKTCGVSLGTIGTAQVLAARLVSGGDSALQNILLDAYLTIRVERKELEQ